MNPVALVIIVALVLGAGLLALNKVGRRLSADILGIKLVVDDVNNAVNHRPEGSPTLYQHAEGTALAVLSLQEKVAQQEIVHEAKHDEIDERLGGIEGRLP